jgi:hypothetical protein
MKVLAPGASAAAALKVLLSAPAVFQLETRWPFPKLAPVGYVAV